MAGGYWKQDVERESRRSDLSTRSLSVHLRDYLQRKYPGVFWIVVVYDPIFGYDKHTLTGDGPNVYHLFRHYGHNIVVCRRIISELPHAPSNLRNTFFQLYYGYEGHQRHISCGGQIYCHTTYTTEYDSHRTYDGTWRNLHNHGVYPTMLLIITSNQGSISLSDSRQQHQSVYNQYMVDTHMSRGNAYAVLVI